MHLAPRKENNSMYTEFVLLAKFTVNQKFLMANLQKCGNYCFMLDEASREVKRVKCSLVASSAHSQIIIITLTSIVRILTKTKLQLSHR